MKFQETRSKLSEKITFCDYCLKVFINFLNNRNIYGLVKWVGHIFMIYLFVIKLYFILCGK